MADENVERRPANRVRDQLSADWVRWRRSTCLSPISEKSEQCIEHLSRSPLATRTHASRIGRVVVGNDTARDRDNTLPDRAPSRMNGSLKSLEYPGESPGNGCGGLAGDPGAFDVGREGAEAACARLAVVYEGGDGST